MSRDYEFEIIQHLGSIIKHIPKAVNLRINRLARKYSKKIREHIIRP